MHRRLTAIAFTLCLCASLCAARPPADQKKGDVRTFELHPVAPPVPALKYRFTYDPVDCYRGNAAIPYLQAMMFLSDKEDAALDKALDALRDKDEATLRAAGQTLLNHNTLFDTLDLAAHADSCEWQPAIRERGIMALLPHLNLMRKMANILRVRAAIQMRDGQVDEALKTIRLGFEMSRDTGREPVLVSGLVGIAIGALTNESLAELMSRPDAPNLYWALASMPRPTVEFRHSMSGERAFLFASVSALKRSENVDELTAQDWRDVMRQISQLMSQSSGANGGKPKVVSEVEITAAAALVLPQAKKYYAESRNVPVEQAEKVEPMKLAGIYYYEQYRASLDEIFKLIELPYPQQSALLEQTMKQFAHRKEQTPTNVFYQLIPALNRASASFARLDRQLAALTAVEAIRSYAAAADGTLPPKLEDISDTPVPINPMTGQAFEYSVEGNTAVLRDSQTKDWVLEYTIKVVK